MLVTLYVIIWVPDLLLPNLLCHWFLEMLMVSNLQKKWEIIWRYWTAVESVRISEEIMCKISINSVLTVAPPPSLLPVPVQYWSRAEPSGLLTILLVCWVYTAGARPGERKYFRKIIQFTSLNTQQSDTK